MPGSHASLLRNRYIYSLQLEFQQACYVIHQQEYLFEEQIFLLLHFYLHRCLSQHDIKHILPTVIGSGLGAWTATEVGEEYLRYTIGGVMLLLLVVTWFRYGDFIRESDKPLSRLKELGGYPLLFVIGFYGGFIQLGVGIFTLAALVLFLNFTLKHANALKNMMNFFLTLPAFCVFAIKGHIMWEVGAVVAVGQTAGAFVAARYAIKSESAQVWIRRLLVLMMLVTASELFGLLSFLRNLLFT